MLHSTRLLQQGAGLAPVLLRRAATVTLDWDTRQKSRFDFTDSTGRHVGVFLPGGGRTFRVETGDPLDPIDWNGTATFSRPGFDGAFALSWQSPPPLTASSKSSPPGGARLRTCCGRRGLL